MDALIESIKRHEGFRDHVYLDSEGNPTCGWGHHLWVGSKVPLPCCEMFLKQDVADAVTSFQKIPRSMRKSLDTVRARVIVEMLFNMNLQRVLQFKKMWAAIEAGDWETAAHEMLDSKWANQVKYRSVEMAQIMRTGQNQE